MKKYFRAILTLVISQPLFAQNPMAVPPVLSGTNIDLYVHDSSHQFLPGQITNTIGINGDFLGPTIVLNKGDSISFHVHNQLADTTTMHWHGLHVAAMNDGGPHTMILPGTTWNPAFKIRDWASTYLYHTHMHMKTAEQFAMGDVGMMIVHDSIENALALPRTYGVDDFPVIVMTRFFDSTNQITTNSILDSIILVNGTIDPFLNLPQQVVRLRLLNASVERTFNFGFTGNKPFLMIGSDGGLLDAPVHLTRIRLSPGERAEILLDLTTATIGDSFFLMSYASELAAGVVGGGIAPNPITGVDFNIMKIFVTAQTASPITSIPATLIAHNPWTIGQADLLRPLTLSGNGITQPFSINSQVFDPLIINYTVHLNDIEVWEINNNTAIAHPFHIHGVQFYILERNSFPPDSTERGRKDELLIFPNETIRFITQFTDFADSVTPFMYHCHMLTHEDMGMMGQYVVIDSSWITGAPQISNDRSVLVFPNPGGGVFRVQSSEFIAGDVLEVFDFFGKKILAEKISSAEIEIDLRRFPDGNYFLRSGTASAILSKIE